MLSIGRRWVLFMGYSAMVDEVADEPQRLLARLRSSAGSFGFLGLLIAGLGLLADGSSPV